MSDTMSSLQQFKIICAGLQDDFSKMADTLDTIDLVSKRVKTGGGALGFVGGAVAVAGIVAMPFTAGLSASLAVFGGGMAAVAGGVAVVGAMTAKIFIEKNELGHVEEKWSTFSGRCKLIFKKFKAGNPQSSKLESILSHICSPDTEAVKDATGLIAVLASVEIEAGITVAVAGSATGARGSTASRAVNRSVIGSVALNAGLVQISLHDIIHAIFTFKTEKESNSKAGDVVRILATSLDQLANLE